MLYLPGNLKLISAQAPTLPLLRIMVGGHYPAPEALPKGEATKVGEAIFVRHIRNPKLNFNLVSHSVIMWPRG